MKLKVTQAVTILLATFLWQAGIAQTVTTNPETWASLIPSGTCTNCTITVPAGFRLNLATSGTCNNCTFNGGTVNITGGFNFGSGTTTFSNDTLLINHSINPNTFVFSSDSVAINATLSNANNTDLISDSRISINASVSLQSVIFTNDSIHLNLNNTLSVSNSPSSFSGSHVSAANGTKINIPLGSFTNSVFALAGNAQLNISNAMTSTGSSFFLQGTSTFKAGSITATNGVFSASNNSSFTSSNAAAFTGADMILNDNATFKANSLTTIGGVFTANGASVITSSNAISLTGTDMTLNGSSILKGGSATIQTGSSLIMTGTASMPLANAFTVTGSTVAMSDTSAITAGSTTIQTSSTLTMGDTSSLTLVNAFDIIASNVFLNGKSAVSDGSTTVENSSDLNVGDGSLASTAHLFTKNTISVLDNSLLKISNGNNYLHTNASSVKGGSTNFSINTNTISCNPTSPAQNLGFANSCSSGFIYGCGTLNFAGPIQCLTLALADLHLSASIAAGTYAEVVLSWQETLQSNTDHFVIQRSSDGTDWTSIGTVADQRTALQGMDYHFADPSALNGPNAYRLRIVDQDGGITYSKIVSVNVTSVTGQMRAYPNPITGQTIQVTTPSPDPVLVKAFSLSGQLLFFSSLKGQTHYQVALPSTVPHNNYIVVQVIGTQRTQSFTLMNL